MSDKTRTSDSAARCLRVMKALKGQTLTGLSNGELAKKLGESPATINRCINTLIAEGLAMKLENGRFVLSIAMLQIAQAHADEMARATGRITELQQRVAAGAY
ncbi:helix-turn-helix domain-containing protein [Neptuniibacter sp.]|uniref:helix-turn-helix domain-containing protein n=1 Tax=Neptuniibacter sp. TaxID=1962643 RepID=UPI003B5BA629